MNTVIEQQQVASYLKSKVREEETFGKVYISPDLEAKSQMGNTIIDMVLQTKFPDIFFSHKSEYSRMKDVKVLYFGRSEESMKKKLKKLYTVEENADNIFFHNTSGYRNLDKLPVSRVKSLLTNYNDKLGERADKLVVIFEDILDGVQFYDRAENRLVPVLHMLREFRMPVIVGYNQDTLKKMIEECGKDDERQAFKLIYRNYKSNGTKIMVKKLLNPNTLYMWHSNHEQFFRSFDKRSKLYKGELPELFTIPSELGESKDAIINSMMLESGEWFADRTLVNRVERVDNETKEVEHIQGHYSWVVKPDHYEKVKYFKEYQNVIGEDSVDKKYEKVNNVHSRKIMPVREFIRAYWELLFTKNISNQFLVDDNVSESHELGSLPRLAKRLERYLKATPEKKLKMLDTMESDYRELFKLFTLCDKWFNMTFQEVIYKLAKDYYRFRTDFSFKYRDESDIVMFIEEFGDESTKNQYISSDLSRRKIIKEIRLNSNPLAYTDATKEEVFKRFRVKRDSFFYFNEEHYQNALPFYQQRGGFLKGCKLFNYDYRVI